MRDEDRVGMRGRERDSGALQFGAEETGEGVFSERGNPDVLR